MLFGDFAEVFFEIEKRGGNVGDYAIMRSFRETVDNMGLRDIGYEGLDFTWFNRRNDEVTVEKRFDRYLVIEDLLDLFPNIKIINLYWDGSDYISVRFDICSIQRDRIEGRNKLFRFGVKWFYEEGFDNTLKQVWEDAEDGSGFIVRKIKFCSELLVKWDKTNFKGVYKRMKWLSKRLERFCKMEQIYNVLEEIRNYESELSGLRRK